VPVVVSSLQDGGHSGDLGVDGDLTTWWQTDRAKGKHKLSSEWITVDLGRHVTVGQVVLIWAENFATSYAIRISSDNNSWSTVYQTTSGNGGTDIISFTPATARYLKLDSTTWNSGSLRNWLRELEVYQGSGTAPPAPTSTPSPTSTPAPGPTATPADPPGGENSMHVGDLAGTSTPGNRNRWSASVTILMHNQDEGALANATVSGIWSNGASGTGSCTTKANGSCTVIKNNIKGNSQQVSFTVQAVSLDSVEYRSIDNHGGAGSGSTISVAKP
jgi:hypothetical protein